MRLDRNINPNGRGKYALLKLRKLDDYTEHGPFGDLAAPVADAIKVLETAGILDWGNTVGSEFFVIRLKDKYADDALFRYSLSAKYDGEIDYAREIEEMANRAGTNHPNCKKPD